VLVLPTGAGKTTLSELKIAATVSAGKKVIFLVPTLALVDQLRDDLAESFPEALTSIEVSADGDLTALINGPELKSIEVMTPERCLALLSFAETDMSELGLLVFDECHLLSPDGGGSRSVDAMLCLLHAIKRAPDADLLLLSAMLKNAERSPAGLRRSPVEAARAFTTPGSPADRRGAWWSTPPHRCGRRIASSGTSDARRLKRSNSMQGRSMPIHMRCSAFITPG
jgi:superfamily II helicase